MSKLFISWSGDDSKQVAETLYAWIPAILQTVKPFISSDDLRKGGRWNVELATELQETNFGIICLTPTNLNAPWILFEAGALSKVVEESHVAPLLVGVQHSDLPTPLTQFNATTADKDDFKKLVKSINSANGADAIAENVLDRIFEAVWPNIQPALVARPKENLVAHKKPSNDEFETFNRILQEVLALVRSQSQLLASPQTLFPVEEIARVVQERKQGGLPPEDHPVWIELSRAFSDLKYFTTVVGPSERMALEALIGDVEGALRYILKRLGRPNLLETATHSRRRILGDRSGDEPKKVTETRRPPVPPPTPPKPPVE